MSPHAEDVAIVIGVDLASGPDYSAVFCGKCRAPIRAHAIFGTVCACVSVTPEELDDLEDFLMTTFDNTDKVNEAMKLVDRLGEKPMPLLQWIDLLEQIRDECRSRIDAARADLANEKEQGERDFDPAD